MRRVLSAPLTHSLILGGARSGKSALAEEMVASHAKAQGSTCFYVATACADKSRRDDDMRTRIDRHRHRRGDRWTTVEEPLDIVGRLRQLARPGGVVLVDCLTLWITNLMAHNRDVAGECQALVTVLPTLRAPVVFVSSEVGSGLVPMEPLSRDFRDHVGSVNQCVGAGVSRVVFVAAGLPLILKSPVVEEKDE